MRASFTPISAEPAGHEKPASPGSSRISGIVRSVGKAVAILLGCAALIMLGVFIARSSAPKTQFAGMPSQSNPSALSDKDVKALVAKVGKHMVLPDETPQIVAIANADQLKIDQPFFRSSQNGDQLLVYANRVILYRPSTDQVVDIAQIRLSPTALPVASVSATRTPSPTIKPEVYATWTPTPSP